MTIVPKYGAAAASEKFRLNACPVAGGLECIEHAEDREEGAGECEDDAADDGRRTECGRREAPCETESGERH